MQGLHIAVVEPNRRCRDSLNLLLSGSGLKISTFTSAKQWLNSTCPSTMDGVILSHQPPQLDGIAELEEILRLQPRAAVILTSDQGEIAIAVEAMKLGAVDWLEKPVDVDRLIKSIARHMSPGQDRRNRDSDSVFSQRPSESLSKRELTIAHLIGQGLLNKQIAHELGISPRTVEVHRANIRRKLGVSNTAEMIRCILHDSRLEMCGLLDKHGAAEPQYRPEARLIQ